MAISWWQWNATVNCIENTIRFVTIVLFILAVLIILRLLVTPCVCIFDVHFTVIILLHLRSVTLHLHYFQLRSARYVDIAIVVSVVATTTRHP